MTGTLLAFISNFFTSRKYKINQKHSLQSHYILKRPGIANWIFKAIITEIKLA